MTPIARLLAMSLTLIVGMPLICNGQIGHSDTVSVIWKWRPNDIRSRMTRINFHAADSSYTYTKSPKRSKVSTGRFAFDGDDLVLLTERGKVFRRYGYQRRYVHLREGGGWVSEYLKRRSLLGRTLRSYPYERP